MANKLVLYKINCLYTFLFLIRRGHHSTSDDSTAYRSKDEIEKWSKKNPIVRLKKFIEKKNIWNDQKDIEYGKETKKQVNIHHEIIIINVKKCNVF